MKKHEGIAIGIALALLFGLGVGQIFRGSDLTERLAETSQPSPLLAAAFFPPGQDLAMGQVTTTALGTAEVLVLASAATEIPALPGRAGIEIFNNGPNTIWCAVGGTGATAVVTKARPIAAGGSWSMGMGDKNRIWCRAATADQVTGAATVASQIKK